MADIVTWASQIALGHWSSDKFNAINEESSEKDGDNDILDENSPEFQ